jgi:hypothetical protein
MPTRYVVQQGEGIDSIAVRHGFSPDALWNDPANAQLKQQRADRNILAPGDVLSIPDKRIGEASGSTQTRHRFRKKGVPAKLRLRLLDGDEPRAHLEYVLDIDGALHQGTTDGDGWLEHPLPPGARQGGLRVNGEAPVQLLLSHLDPLDTVSGAKARLANLGFHQGPIDDERMTEATVEAIVLFQRKYELEETGQLDQATRDKLVEVHGA